MPECRVASTHRTTVPNGRGHAVEPGVWCYRRVECSQAFWDNRGRDGDGDGRVVGVVSALPDTGAGVNPGRFGLAVSLAEADRDFLEQAIAAGFGLD